MDDGGIGAVYSPEYNTVRRTLEYGLFFVVVGRATATLTELLAESEMASLTPRVTFAAAVALWAMLVLTIGREALRQYRANPHETDDVHGLLAELRPDPRRVTVAAGVGLIGGVVVAIGWVPFFGLLEAPAETFELVQRTISGTAGGSGLDLAAALLGSALVWVAVFPAGFVALAYGVDHLLVGGVREVQYRRSARE